MSHTGARDVLHFTYYFRHVYVAQNNETVYVVVVRVLDELANHGTALTSRSGNLEEFLAQLTEIFILVGQVLAVSVCVCVCGCVSVCVSGC